MAVYLGPKVGLEDVLDTLCGRDVDGQRLGRSSHLGFGIKQGYGGHDDDVEELGAGVHVQVGEVKNKSKAKQSTPANTFVDEFRQEV